MALKSAAEIADGIAAKVHKALAKAGIVDDGLSDSVRTVIIAALENYAKEAYQEGRCDEGILMDIRVTEVREEARQQAFEEAAKIAEQRPTGSSDDGLVVQKDIAWTIRAKAREA